MFLFRLIKEVRQATKLENEVRSRVSRMTDPNALTIENLELQVIVLKSDLDRYSKRDISTSMRNDIDWKMASTGLKGFVDIYESVIKEGISKWSDSKYLEQKYNEVKEEMKKYSDPYVINYCLGKMKAIAGLQEGQLYHSWSDPKVPIGFNQRFIEIIQRRGLL